MNFNPIHYFHFTYLSNLWGRRQNGYISSWHFYRIMFDFSPCGVLWDKKVSKANIQTTSPLFDECHNIYMVFLDIFLEKNIFKPTGMSTYYASCAQRKINHNQRLNTSSFNDVTLTAVVVKELSSIEFDYPSHSWGQVSDHVFAFGVVWVVVGCCVVEIGVVQQLTETIKTMSVLLVQDRGGYRIMGT